MQSVQVKVDAALIEHLRRLLKNSRVFRHFEMEAKMFPKRQGEEKQEEFWIERGRVSKPSRQGFYGKLNEHLAAMDFAQQVWAFLSI